MVWPGASQIAWAGEYTGSFYLNKLDTKGTESRQGTLFPKEHKFLTSLCSLSLCLKVGTLRAPGPQSGCYSLSDWGKSCQRSFCLQQWSAPLPPDLSPLRPIPARLSSKITYSMKASLTYPPGRIFCWLLGGFNSTSSIKRRSKAST